MLTRTLTVLHVVDLPPFHLQGVSSPLTHRVDTPAGDWEMHSNHVEGSRCGQTLVLTQQSPPPVEWL